MNKVDLEEILKFCRTTLDNLKSNSLVETIRAQNDAFNNALKLIEKYLPIAENAVNQDKADLSMRTATIFLVSLWSKLRKGGTVGDLTREDWNNIIGNAAETAVTIEPTDYSKMVFDLYRRSIDFAIDPMRQSASESVINRLEEIVSIMNCYAEDLDNGDVSEVKFIEENLWLSLEAVFLVLSDRMTHKVIPNERQELADAIGALVFQKFRYSHYEKELAAINECLEYQSDLDQRLETQVNAYIDALNDELDTFDEIVERAFNTTDFQMAFRGSVELAQLMGSDEALQTQQDVDDYFLS